MVDGLALFSEDWFCAPTAYVDKYCSGDCVDLVAYDIPISLTKRLIAMHWFGRCLSVNMRLTLVLVTSSLLLKCSVLCSRVLIVTRHLHWFTEIVNVIMQRQVCLLNLFRSFWSPGLLRELFATRTTSLCVFATRATMHETCVAKQEAAEFLAQI